MINIVTMKLSEIFENEQRYISHVGRSLQSDKRSHRHMVARLTHNLLTYLAHLKGLPYTY